jgi:hypothetical protein
MKRYRLALVALLVATLAVMAIPAPDVPETKGVLYISGDREVGSSLKPKFIGVEFSEDADIRYQWSVTDVVWNVSSEPVFRVTRHASEEVVSLRVTVREPGLTTKTYSAKTQPIAERESKVGIQLQGDNLYAQGDRGGFPPGTTYSYEWRFGSMFLMSDAVKLPVTTMLFNKPIYVYQVARTPGYPPHRTLSTNGFVVMSDGSSIRLGE